MLDTILRWFKFSLYFRYWEDEIWVWVKERTRFMKGTAVSEEAKMGNTSMTTVANLLFSDLVCVYTVIPFLCLEFEGSAEEGRGWMLCLEWMIIAGSWFADQRVSIPWIRGWKFPTTKLFYFLV